MKISTSVRALAVSGVLTSAAVLGLAAPAQAAADDPFSVCYVDDACSVAFTSGTITWFNRTASVSGKVVDVGAGSTTAVFEAFAGSTKIDSTTRTADDQGSATTKSPRSFGFTIGDTNLVGGINRIKITVCVNLDGSVTCGTSKNEIKD